jgi:hypothetical protein
MSRVNPYASIEKRRFESALLHLLLTDYGMLQGGRRIAQLLVEDVMALLDEFFPDSARSGSGALIWSCTADEGKKAEPGKRTEEYKTITVQLPLVTTALLKYNPAFNHQRLLRFPQIPNVDGANVLAKLEQKSQRTIKHYFSTATTGYLMHYHRSPRYWIRGIDFAPHFRSATRTRSIHHFRDLYFKELDEGKVFGAILNSSLFYFWFIAMGNGRNITGIDIEEFPVGELARDVCDTLIPIFDNLMEDYKKNSIIRVRANQEYQEFYQSKSKPIIDEIDRVLAQHYGFTAEELDFIINYDIKYRLGDDLFTDDEEL